MSDGIKIGQALFGYRDGHHLIASSMVLSPHHKVYLANLTDSSGPDASSQFPRSITGTSIPGWPVYVLFCTWPAPEMPRPGCVWSHVLFVRLEDLARIPNLEALTSLFLRPASPPVVSEYEQPLTLSNGSFAEAGSSPDPARTYALLEVLYESPESGVVLLDQSNFEWERPLFAVWSQQWPRLRRAFSFSTGSFSDRRVSSDLYFDLQIAPDATERLWRRANSPTVVTRFQSNPSQRKIPSWLETAYRDIDNWEREARQFLFAFGGDVDSRRAAFIPLLEVYGKLTWPDSPSDQIEAMPMMAAAFPGPSEALALKRHVVNLLLRTDSELTPNHAWAVLFFLSSSNLGSAFSEVQVDLAEFVPVLWKRRRAELLSLIDRGSSLASSKPFLGALSEQVVPEELPSLFEEHPATASSVLRVKPSLLQSESAWKASHEDQETMWLTVASLELGADYWASILSPMLIANVGVRQLQTVQNCGEGLVTGMTKWADSPSFGRLSSSWRSALKSPLTASMASDGELPERLLLFAASLSPYDAARLDGNRQDILSLADRRYNQDWPQQLRGHFDFWMTSLGLQTSGSAGATLLCAGFFEAYASLSRSYYAPESWGMLEPFLPNAKFGWEWDHCKRMRAALRNWIGRSGNAGQRGKLMSAAPSEELRRVIARA